MDGEVLKTVRDAVSLMKQKARNLDSKTLHDLSSSLHDGLSTVEKYKGVRTTQPTARVGGRRARRPGP